MQRIHTCRELQAVIEGGFRFLFEQFDKGRIMCHPIAPLTFLPSKLDFIPDDVKKGMALGWLLLYSTDGKTWTYNFKEVINEARQTDGHFYITDWKFNVLFEVESYQMDEVINLLTMEYEGMTLIEGFKWKEADLGSIESYSLEEYFSSPA